MGRHRHQPETVETARTRNARLRAIDADLRTFDRTIARHVAALQAQIDADPAARAKLDALVQAWSLRRAALPKTLRDLAAGSPHTPTEDT